MSSQVTAQNVAPNTPVERSVTPGQPQEAFEVQEPEAQEAEVVYPTGAKLVMAMTSVVIVSVLSGLDTAIVAATVPSLTNYFRTLEDIGWYTSAYGVILAAFILTFGKLYTLFTVKKVFLSGLGLFQLGCLISTVAQTSHMFILGRAISGLGTAGAGGGLIIIIAQCHPVHKRPIWMAVAGGAQSVGLVSAPVVGGALIDWLGWRACFGISIPPGLLVIAMVAYGFQEPLYNPDTDLPFRQKLQRIDILGTVIMVPAVTCLLLALQFAGTRYGWSNPRVISLVVLFVVLLLAFGGLQYRLGEKATIPPRILKIRSILAGSWYSACLSGVLAVTEYYMSIYFQGVKGYSAGKSGTFMLPMLLGLGVAAVIGGAGITKVGYYVPFMIATTVLAPIASGLLTTIKPSDNQGKAPALLGFLGVAVGLGLGGPINAVSASLPTKDISIGMAMTGFGGGMGSSLFVAGSAALFQNRLVKEINRSSPGTNVTTLENIGLSDMRKVLGDDRLNSVLLGYDEAVVQTLYLPVALGCATLIGTLLTEWRSVKKKQS